MIDVWADVAGWLTAGATIVAATAAIVAGVYAKKAYETSRSQLRASQQPFIVPNGGPLFTDNRPDLLDTEKQVLRLENIGYGPAFNVRATLCGKRPTQILAEFYGRLEGTLTFPLRVDADAPADPHFRRARGEPSTPIERPEGYEQPGKVTDGVARLVIRYTDIGLVLYQTVYEWKDRSQWELQTSPDPSIKIPILRGG